MRFRRVLRPLALSGLLAAALLPHSSRAQAIDPAVVGERLQRLNVTVESLEATRDSQRRQIDALGTELNRLRDQNARDLATLASRGSQRPWADDIKRHNDDLKRLAEAITEVDRKRIADHEQILKVLGELRKSVAALAEAPAPASRTPPRGDRTDRDRTDKPDRSEKPDPSDGGAEPAAPVKAIPYTVGRGETVSLIVMGFNTDAKRKGYQPLTTQQVLKFNKITDARKLAAGATLNLPLIPAVPPKP